MVAIEEARKREPMISGQDGSEVLHSPNTAVVDIHACLKHVYQECQDINPNFRAHFGADFLEPYTLLGFSPHAIFNPCGALGNFMP